MARLLAAYRGTRWTRSERTLMRPGAEEFTKPMLVFVLQSVQTLTPPRVRSQSKDELVRRVRWALEQDGTPVRAATVAAMQEARLLEHTLS